GSAFIFFFQAEDGIRDFHVTGVQTCALPISIIPRSSWDHIPMGSPMGTPNGSAKPGMVDPFRGPECFSAQFPDEAEAGSGIGNEIGRASWRRGSGARRAL